MSDFIEIQIIKAVKKLLTGKTNEILNGLEKQIPVCEISEYFGGTAIVPVITLSKCERTEKDRIIKQDNYVLTICLNFYQDNESEFFCYAYSSAIEKAVKEDITLGGIADRTTIIQKKYLPPKTLNNGEGWDLHLSLCITVEEMAV